MYIISLLVALLSVLLIGTSGESSSIPAGKLYWNNVLPKTSMPKAIKDLLMQPAVAASTTKVLPTSKVLPTRFIWKEASTAKVLPTRFIWKEASSRKNKKIAGDENSSYDPTITVFFFEKNLQAGTKMTLSFPDTSVYGAKFISKTQSNSIPFASSKLPDILSLFSINPTSPVASAMNETLATCEDKPMKYEIKRCATSLESMVDFTISTLGTHNLLSISTTTDKGNTPKQEYEVTSSKVYNGTKLSGDNTVVCHAQTYAYAVFNCHKLRGVDVYGVEMVGADGSKVAAVATCYRDTSEWNPKNLALRILNVKPGTVPVCHFLPQYDVLWMSNK